MIAAERLLRLYPRAWRNRYGEEFLNLAGSGPLRLQQVIDIVCGAVDAWLSADVRHATTGSRVAANEGGTKMWKSLLDCERNAVRYTARDGLIAAAVMLVVTFVLTLLGHAVTGIGWTATGDILTKFGFLIALTLTFPLWVMKGQPWKAQAAIMGTTLTFLVLLGYFG